MSETAQPLTNWRIPTDIRQWYTGLLGHYEGMMKYLDLPEDKQSKFTQGYAAHLADRCHDYIINRPKYACVPYHIREWYKANYP